MKKILTLTALLLLVVIGSSAQVRKSWDFTKWSATTLSNLANNMATYSGAQWRDYEKDEATSPETATAYWSGTRTAGPLTVKVGDADVIIPETQYLSFASTTTRKLVISFGQTSTSLGEYKGGGYLWINGKSETITLPKVKRGETVKMGIESHKLTEARGVDLKVDGTKVTATEGNPIPKTYEDVTWTIPAGEGDSAAVSITSTNGCHIYYIKIGNGDDHEVDQPTKVGLLYDSSYSGFDLSSDIISSIVLPGIANTDVKPINISGDVSTVTLDSLMKFDVLVVHNAINSANPFVSNIKKAISFEPMLNLGTGLYGAWSLGTATPTEKSSVTIDGGSLSSPLFTDAIVEADNSLELQSTGNITGVSFSPGTYFSNDSILATVGSVNAIHIHNLNRNAYMLLPYSYDQLSGVNSDNIVALITNAISMLKSSKVSVTNTSAPTISSAYNDGNTEVTIESGTKNAVVYYTLDGSVPTESSTRYEGPISVSSATTVKAFAAADGYYNSTVSSTDVIVKIQAKSPEFTQVRETGKTTITYTSKTDGVEIYFNYTGSNVQTASQKYTEPIVITRPATITAFASGGDYVQSPLSTISFGVNGYDKTTVRLDTLAHFDANSTDYSLGESKTKYYAGQSGYAYYSTNIKEESHITGSQGQDSIVYVYYPKDSVVCVNPQKGWEIATQGQVVIWESTSPTVVIGDGSGYNPETASDCGASKGDITFSKVGATGDPNSAYIMTTVAHKGPFDVVTYIANGNGSSTPKVDVWISTDTTNVDGWVKLGDCQLSSTRRLIKKTYLSYEGTDNVFVKVASGQGSAEKAMVLDIYLMNNAENSEKYVDGISDVHNNSCNIVRTEVYSMGGVLQKGMSKGFNIVRNIYSDGSVKTQKVMVKE